MMWETVANISTTAMMIIAIPATAFALLQMVEMKRSSRLSAFVAVVESLQKEEVRNARATLIGLKNKSFESWSPQEVEAADLALRKYNFVAIMVSNRLIPARFILPELSTSLVLCWEAAQPMIKKYRNERGTNYWEKLEVLYNLAKSYRD